MVEAVFTPSINEAETMPVQALSGAPVTSGPTSIFHQSGIGLILIGPKKKSLLMNKEALTILAKIKSLSPLGTDFLKAFPNAVYKAVTEPLEEDAPVHRGVFQSGHRRYSVWTAPVFNLTGRTGGGTVAGTQRMIVLERVASKDPNLSTLARKFKLTARESQVVRLLAKGKSDKLISYSLGLSIETVRGHMKHVRSKMGVTSRLEVVSLLSRVS
jgi:DNA-binding CsgD family transcriptional regulator